MVPALVLLPGMDGTGDLFAPLVEALGPSVRTHIVRYPDEPLDYASHEAIARAALPAGHPYILLGESFSGPIAVSIAASAPADLRGYVLCCSFVKSPRRALTWFRWLLRLLTPQRIPDAVAAYFLMGRFASSEIRRMHAQALTRVSPRTLVARLKAIATVDVSDALRGITVPSLYLRATEDRLVPASAAELFSRVAKNSRVVDIEGPHFLLQARPETVADVLRCFSGQLA